MLLLCYLHALILFPVHVVCQHFLISQPFFFFFFPGFMEVTFLSGHLDIVNPGDSKCELLQ